MPASDVVQMTHPELPGRLVTATRRQFDEVWKGRGWRTSAPGPEPEQDRDEAAAVPPGRRKTAPTTTPDAPAPDTSKEH